MSDNVVVEFNETESKIEVVFSPTGLPGVPGADGEPGAPGEPGEPGPAGGVANPDPTTGQYSAGNIDGRNQSADIVKSASATYDGAAKSKKLHMDGISSGFDSLAAFLTKQYGHASLGLTSDSTGADANQTNGRRWFYWLSRMIVAANPDVYVRYRCFDGSVNITDAFGNATGTLAWRPAAILNAPSGVSRSHAYFSCVGGGRGISHTTNPSHDTVDLDVTVELSPDSWTGASTMISRTFTGSFDVEFRPMGDGTWRLRWYENSGTLRTVSFSAPSPAVPSPTVGSATDPGTPLYVRFTLDSDNGAGGYTATLRTSPTNDGFNWTTHQTVTVAGVTNVRQTVGAIWALGYASTYLPGNYYEIWIRGFINGPPILPVHVNDWSPALFSEQRGGPSLDIWNASWPGENIAGTFDNATRAPWMMVDSSTLCWIISTSHNDNLDRNSLSYDAWEQMVSNHRGAMPKSQLVAISQNPDTGEYLSGDAKRQFEAQNNGPAHTMRTIQLASIWDRLGVHGVDTARAFYEDPRIWTNIMNGQHHPNDDATGLTNRYDLKTGVPTNPVVRQAQLVYNAIMNSQYATANSGELTRS